MNRKELDYSLDIYDDFKFKKPSSLHGFKKKYSALFKG